MNWITNIARMFCGHTAEPKLRAPYSTKRTTIKALVNLLRAKFPDAEIYLSDKEYTLCSLADIRYFLKRDKTNRYEYEAEAMDCDDFSYRLMGQFSVPEWSGLTFGICWTDVHALNCLMGEDLKFYFIEPQKDAIQETLKPWQGSKVTLIMI